MKGAYIYIWVFVMESCINSDIHLVSQLSGTFKLPPGHILTEHAKTSCMPDVMSGSSITVDLLDLIIFLMPSWVQMTPMKFVDVKSVPSITGHCMCLQTIKDWVNG